MESASIFTTLLQPARIEIGRNVIEVGELRRLNFVLFVPFVKRLFNGGRLLIGKNLNIVGKQRIRVGDIGGIETNLVPRERYERKITEN